MFGVSFEHLIIVGVILLFVGPKRLPELGNTLGKGIKNFKDSFNGIEEAPYKRINEAQAEAQVKTEDQPKTENQPNPPPAPPA